MLGNESLNENDDLCDTHEQLIKQLLDKHFDCFQK
jgi:hypothetical protein